MAIFYSPYNKVNYVIAFVESIFFALRPAFSRQATFHWFVIVAVGCLMRSDFFGGLRYHFLSRYLPSCSRKPAKKGTPKPISSKPEKTLATLAAIEKFVVIQCIFVGIVQMAALRFPARAIAAAGCWLRTLPENIPSEFMTKLAIVNSINLNLSCFAKNLIPSLIQKYRKKPKNSPALLKRTYDCRE
ncbi:MAG: hypothetical protein JW795_19840 [Chitinivibrionales bacterium]|nr:hypothetical protein [Chitinivibrionales bacterium]